jgi:multidrug efflux pump subunit AcrA (membrane-fusion protein)
MTPERPDLLDQRDEQLESIKLLARQPSYATLGRWLLALFVVLVLASFLPWRQNIQGYGEVTALRPEDRPQQAVATVGGRLAEWFVQEGDIVSAGDPLVALAEVKEAYLDPSALDRLGQQVRAKRQAVNEKRAKAEALAVQGRALDSAWHFARIRADNRITQLTASLQAAQLEDSLATVQAARIATLFADGLRSRADMEMAQQRAQRAEALAVEQAAALATARADRAGVDADFTEKIAKVDGDRSATLAEVSEGVAEIAKLSTGQSNLEERRELLVVRAPRDGIVVQVLKTGIGEIVADGGAIATVQPANPKLAVALQVNPRDLPLLKVGDQVRLEFAGWPAMQFSGWPSVAVGTFGGRVAVIDPVAQASGSYRILVDADPSDEPWPDLLRIGSGARGWALLRRVPVWFEIWRLLNGFPPSLRDANGVANPGSSGAVIGAPATSPASKPSSGGGK